MEGYKEGNNFDPQSLHDPEPPEPRELVEKLILPSYDYASLIQIYAHIHRHISTIDRVHVYLENATR